MSKYDTKSNLDLRALQMWAAMGFDVLSCQNAKEGVVHVCLSLVHVQARAKVTNTRVHVHVCTSTNIIMGSSGLFPPLF